MTTDTITMTANRTVRLLRGDYSRDAGVPRPPDGASAEVLVLPGADPGALAELRLTPESLVLTPAGETYEFAGAEVVAYSGDLTGDEQEILLDGGIAVRRESYTVAPFMPVTCLTAIAILDADDHENFLADADAAVQDGTFEEHLRHPLAILADVCALGACRCAAPSRARAVVGEEGARPALGGAPFADEDVPGSACTVCLAGVVDREALLAGHRSRPWLPRYLHVLDVLRAMRTRLGADVDVSGFGRRFSGSLAPEPLEDLDAPVLLRSDDEYLVCDPISRRVLRIGRDAARVMEVALATSAVEDVARHLELPERAAFTAVEELQGTLDRIGFTLALAEGA